MACIGTLSRSAYKAIDCLISQQKHILWATKTYFVGSQKNRLNETVLLSTKLLIKTYVQENINDFTLKNVFI